MGSGIGQLLHGSVVGAVLIVISLPFIAVTVASALLGRRQRRQLEVLRQRVSRLAATVTVYQVVSKLQPGASCIVSWGGSSDEVERPAASSDEG